MIGNFGQTIVDHGDRGTEQFPFIAGQASSINSKGLCELGLGPTRAGDPN